MRNILFVCTGNICRSPMAEGVLRQRIPELVVYSAGLHAITGAHVDSFAVDVVRARGVDIRGHRARSISGWMIDHADLVLAMDLAQESALFLKYPAFNYKIRRLGEHGDFDIPDPHQKGKQAFFGALSLITRGIDEWVASSLSTDSHQKGVQRHGYAS
jgi:protein-tyrosine phosphatase